MFGFLALNGCIRYHNPWFLLIISIFNLLLSFVSIIFECANIIYIHTPISSPFQYNSLINVKYVWIYYKMLSYFHIQSALSKSLNLICSIFSVSSVFILNLIYSSVIFFKEIPTITYSDKIEVFVLLRCAIFLCWRIILYSIIIKMTRILLLFMIKIRDSFHINWCVYYLLRVPKPNPQWISNEMKISFECHKSPVGIT